MSKGEALRLALEALESTGENDGYHGVDQYFDNVLVEKAITAIKEALETKDEPVAWMNKHGACKTSLFREEEAGAKEEYTIPVYTTPPQRTWIGLTEEDLKPICDEWRIVYGTWTHDFAREIETKLKEKNHGN